MSLLIGTKRSLLTVGGKKPEARVYDSGNQSIPNETHVALTFDSERFDTGSTHSKFVDATKLVCKKTGPYLIGGSCQFEAHAVSVRLVFLNINGTTPIVAKRRLGGASVVNVTINCMYHLTKGEYVELVVWQRSLVTLDINAVPNYSPEMYIIWMGG